MSMFLVVEIFRLHAHVLGMCEQRSVHGRCRFWAGRGVL